MPLFQAAAFLAAVIVLIVAAQSRRLHPFLAILVVASAFGLAAGFSIAFVAKTFGTGFAQAIYSPGLVIIGAGFVAGLAESTGASQWFAAKIGGRWSGSGKVAALLGFIAGVGASPAAAFALTTPLVRCIAGGTAPDRQTATLAQALAISASHGLVFSPVLIAAASILDAAWGRVALFGIPVALLLVAFGWTWARWLSGASIDSDAFLANDELPAGPEKQGRRSAIVLLVATVVPLLMLMVQSIGDMPSEPLGGGTKREMVLGFGRPLMLFLVGLGIMVIGQWRLSLKLLADSAWTERVLGKVVGILMIVGAAGGLQRLCQETGMSELLGERLLGFPGGLLVPFLIAALIKTLQGSSLVAAITTAGMVQPILMQLGIGGESGKALAALAIGAGAMTLSHVNDEYFWLVTTNAKLAPARGLVAIGLGTLLQGLIAVGTLFILSLVASGV